MSVKGTNTFLHVGFFSYFNIWILLVSDLPWPILKLVNKFSGTAEINFFSKLQSLSHSLVYRKVLT